MPQGTMRPLLACLTLALIALNGASAQPPRAGVSVGGTAQSPFLGALIEKQDFGLNDLLPKGSLESGSAMSCDAARDPCRIGPFTATTHVTFGAIPGFAGTVEIRLITSGRAVDSMRCESPGTPSGCVEFTQVVPATFYVDAIAVPGTTGGYTLYAIYG